jgi:hypothetical protein
VLGSDTGNSLVHPKFDKLANPTHQVGIVAMGLWILDNADLEGLAEACAQRGKWEFMMTINPLRIEGATGYPVNPIAVF